MKNAALTLSFWGATGTVTGSKYHVSTPSRNVLVDCGLFQGFKQLRLRNWAPLPGDPATIHAVVLTHAHIDHSGYLPLLVRNGFQGPVLCTQATRDLCGVLLPDAGYLQEEEARYANRHGYSKHTPALPLYTQEDAIRSLNRIVTVKFDESVDLGDGLTMKLTRAGHLLGAACVTLARAGCTLVFSGDLGRPHDPVMQPPTPIRHADYLVIESTYGDRRHEAADAEMELASIVNRTVSRGGVVLIPAFAVGRAQTILHYLSRLKKTGSIPDVPVFLNSPMAIDATSLYRPYADQHRLTPDEYRSLCAVARFVSSADESKRLNTRSGSMIVISASGMATGGRVLHHLKAFATDPRNTIVFAGFQVPGTRGAAMVDGAEAVKIHGEYIPVKAEVVALSGTSGHADACEILEWLRGFQHAPRRTFLTHGEPGAVDALRQRIERELGWDCHIPEYRETCALTTAGHGGERSEGGKMIRTGTGKG